MRHIELIGLPAAGKSTLVKELRHGNLARNHAIVAPLGPAPVTPAAILAKRFRDITWIVRHLLGSPVRSRRIWRACSAFRQPSKALWLRMYLSCLRADELARNAHTEPNKKYLMILDQGIYQAVWSMALRTDFRSREQLFECCRRLLDCLAAPELIVLVDTPAGVARQRLANEPGLHGRLPKLLESDSSWMLRAQEILDVLWEIACNETSVKTFRYIMGKDTHNDLEFFVRHFLGNGEMSDT